MDPQRFCVSSLAGRWLGGMAVLLLAVSALACWNPSDDELLARKMLDEQIKLPLPPRTDVIVYDHYAKWGQSSAETRFSTVLAKSQIEKFYQQQLSKRGWNQIPAQPGTAACFCRNGWLAELEFSTRHGGLAEYTLDISRKRGPPRSPCHSS
jgi:hypothetical protein